MNRSPKISNHFHFCSFSYRIFYLFVNCILLRKSKNSLGLLLSWIIRAEVHLSSNWPLILLFLLFRFSINIVFTRPNLCSQNTLIKKKRKRKVCNTIFVSIWLSAGIQLLLRLLMTFKWWLPRNTWAIFQIFAFRIRDKNISC